MLQLVEKLDSLRSPPTSDRGQGSTYKQIDYSRYANELIPWRGARPDINGVGSRKYA
jgi:hypothetical protein